VFLSVLVRKSEWKKKGKREREREKVMTREWY
jgi:hypothetical protein